MKKRKTDNLEGLLRFRNKPKKSTLTPIQDLSEGTDFVACPATLKVIHIKFF